VPCLDLRGLKCPLPVLHTRKALAEAACGALIFVECTDPLSVIDLPHFCREYGHFVEEYSSADGVHRFLIRRG
jgi:tRNA 2-thiouridine synthesizing protein A